MIVAIRIPGKPHAQGRARAVRRGRTLGVIDPPESRAWKEAAACKMRECR